MLDIQRISSVLEHGKEHQPLLKQDGAYFLGLETGDLVLVEEEDCQQMRGSRDAGREREPCVQSYRSCSHHCVREEEVFWYGWNMGGIHMKGGMMKQGKHQSTESFYVS